ncbi:MAG: glycosyltransferase family 2 protein [Pseudohongiellaceae bacterium]
MIRISCIIPTFNYGHFIIDAVDSALDALRDDDQIIVIDDGSTDDTRQRLDSYISDNRIQYHYQDNAGVGAARNAGTQMADGDYLYFLDADDRVIKAGFSKLRQAVERNQGIAAVIAGHISVNGQKRRERRQKPFSSNKATNFVDYAIRRRFSMSNTGATLFKRDIALKYPYPDIKTGEDMVVYALILANEYVMSIPDSSVVTNRHADSLREQPQGYANTVEHLPDLVFDETRLPAPLMKWKQQFYCNCLLSLFREQYLSGEYEAARHTYQRARQLSFRRSLQLSYLRKYLKMRLKFHFFKSQRQ